jgi:hypothetical protein
MHFPDGHNRPVFLVSLVVTYDYGVRRIARFVNASGYVLMVVFSMTILLAQTTKLPGGKGKAEVQRICSDCHEVAIVTREHHTKSEWTQVIEQMKSRGASGTEDEFNLIIDYLTTNFGTPSSSESKSK